MKTLSAELDRNFTAFQSAWKKQITDNSTALAATAIYKSSYKRLCALYAIKSYIVDKEVDSGSAAFFLEAHNDALVSHVAASFGSWRTALQALRSCMENALACLYFKDHPVELALWESGKVRAPSSDLLAYFEKHPTLQGLSHQQSGIEVIRKEYATLSKAVHASARGFRMTQNSPAVLLWSTEKSRAAMWAARERKVCEGIISLACALFAQSLQGTKNSAVREMLYFVLPPAKRVLLKNKLKITVPSP